MKRSALFTGETNPRRWPLIALLVFAAFLLSAPTPFASVVLADDDSSDDDSSDDDSLDDEECDGVCGCDFAVPLCGLERVLCVPITCQVGCVSCCPPAFCEEPPCPEPPGPECDGGRCACDCPEGESCFEVDLEDDSSDDDSDDDSDSSAPPPPVCEDFFGPVCDGLCEDPTLDCVPTAAGGCECLLPPPCFQDGTDCCPGEQCIAPGFCSADGILCSICACGETNGCVVLCPVDQ